MKIEAKMAALLLLGGALMGMGSLGRHQQVDEGAASVVNRSHSLGATRQVTGAELARNGDVEPLMEVQNIKVEGFESARVFFGLIKADLLGESGELLKPGTSRVAIEAYHAIHNVSYRYYREVIDAVVDTHLDGFVSIPIIGKEMRIVIRGYELPRMDAKIHASMYLVK
jgi:hypothetical protein